MIIYKYSMKKYMKSPSTWIIIAFGVAIAFISGYLPFNFLDVNSPKASTHYATIIAMVASGVTSLVSMFVSIFAGFKSAQMFKDEVEDGTFLVMLSKPVTRRRLILFKWLALQTMMILFAFIIVMVFGIVVTVFDNASQIPSLAILGVDSLKSQILTVGGIMFGIFILIGLIFSSIALLLSTKVTTGATIGIAIGLGVIIPITGIVGMFTKKQEYDTLYNQNMVITDGIAKTISENKKMKIPLMNDFSKDFNDFFQNLKQSKNSLYSLGIKTGENDGFKNLWPIDLQYQLSQLSTFASNKVIPSFTKEIVEHSEKGKALAVKTSFADTGYINDIDEIEKRVQKSILNNKLLNKARASFFNTFHEMPVLSILMTQNPLLDKIKGLHITKQLFEEAFYQVGWGLRYTNDYYTKTTTDKKEKEMFINFATLGKALQGIYHKHWLATPKPADAGDLSFKETLIFLKAMLDFNYLDFTHSKAVGSTLPAGITDIKGTNPIERMKDRDFFKPNGELNDKHGTGHDSHYISRFMSLLSKWDVSLQSNSKLTESEIKESKEIINFVKETKTLANSMYSPLSSLFINNQNLRKAINEREVINFDSKTLNNIKNKLFKIDDASGKRNPDYLQLSSQDETTLIYLARVSVNLKDHLSKVENSDYVNPYMLLIVYLVVALLLVPLSYLLIKRQDFR